MGSSRVECPLPPVLFYDLDARLPAGAGPFDIFCIQTFVNRLRESLQSLLGLSIVSCRTGSPVVTGCRDRSHCPWRSPGRVILALVRNEFVNKRKPGSECDQVHTFRHKVVAQCTLDY